MRIRYIGLFSLLITGVAYADSNDKAFRWEPSVNSQLYAPLSQALPRNQYSTMNGEITLPDGLYGDPFLVVVRDPDCPVSRRYAPYLQNLQSNIEIIYLLTGELANKSTALHDQQRHQLNGIYILDTDRRLSHWLGVHSSGEVYLFDEKARLRYRGAIDDRFGIGFSRTEARQSFLADALRAVRAGLAVDIPATIAPGCIVNTPTSSTIREPEDVVTWHNQVSQLMTNKCQLCHRPGQAGPFPLQTYQQVTQRKAMIRFVLENRIMPPWFAAGDPERWTGNRHLAAVDRQLLIDWIDAGAPEGTPVDGAPIPNWKSGWQLGEPDVVLSGDRELHIPAQGEVAYKYISLSTDFSEDRWIQTIEVSTDTPQNTHHILAFILPPVQLQDKLIPGVYPRTDLSRKEKHLLSSRGFFGGYVAGLPGLSYPNGSAKLLPKGWRILLQMHHEANGVAAKDKPRVGLQFLNTFPQRVIETRSATNIDLRIPPGESRHLEAAEYTFENSGHILGFFPHMHLRGSAFRYVLREPDGSEEVVLDVPRYDPNWQVYYQLKEPIRVDTGSVLLASGWYDNSDSNPNNPDPKAEVRFGLTTHDEMMMGYFDWAEAPLDSASSN